MTAAREEVKTTREEVTATKDEDTDTMDVETATREEDTAKVQTANVHRIISDDEEDCVIVEPKTNNQQPPVAPEPNVETSRKRENLTSNSELVVDVSDPDVVSGESDPDVVSGESDPDVVSGEGDCIVDDDVNYPATSEEDAFDDASDFEETNDRPKKPRKNLCDFEKDSFIMDKFLKGINKVGSEQQDETRAKNSRKRKSQRRISSSSGSEKDSEDDFRKMGNFVNNLANLGKKRSRITNTASEESSDEEKMETENSIDKNVSNKAHETKKNESDVDDLSDLVCL